MKQKKRSFSCSYILIPFLFTLYTAGIHHKVFTYNSYICHLNIIILLYHSISLLSKIIILSPLYQHIIFKQNHHIIIIKQNHYIIIIISVYHHIIFKQNHYIIIIKQNHYYHTNIIIISYKIITGEIILIKKKLSLIIGSKTHPDPLCTNQFSIRNC